MLEKIIRFSVQNKLIIGLFTLALMGWGIYAASKLPIDAVPDITNNQVQVITVSPSLAAPEIERLITFPIEQATSNIPGMEEMRSFSRFGLSLVTIVFSDATDVYWARQQVTERLQQVRAQIPPDAGNPELAPVTTGLGEIYQYVIRPKKGYEKQFSPQELRTIQDWIVRRQLLGTPGVADVSSFGGYLKQYEVSINPSKLQSLHVTIPELFDALQRNNQNTGGSYIEKGPNILFIRTEGLAATVNDIENIVVKNTDEGMPVFVRDLATIKIGHANRYGAMTYNDQGEVTGAVVMMLKGENSSKVIKAVKKRMAQIAETLPEGVMIEPFLDRTKMVNNAIGTVEKNLAEGALIVVFILVLFLGNLRAGLIVASVIPLSMLFAISMMNLFGVSGNLMSLGALDFGLIVDGAVIIVEAVLHQLHLKKPKEGEALLTQEHLDKTVGSAAGKMMGSAVFGQIVILIVYLPILTLIGIEGKMFRPMAQTVSFALIGAFIFSLTYIPMISSLLLSKKQGHRRNFSDRMMSWLQVRYQRMLQLVLRFPRTVIALSLLWFASAVFILLHMGGEFIPKLEEGDFAVDTRTLTGSSLATTVEATQQTAGILLKRFPEVEKVVSKIGSGEIPTDPMPVEAADMMVILKDKKDWVSAKTFDELANKMSEALQDVPGVTSGFQYPVQMRFNELMTGARQDVVCKIFGEDLDTLAAYANKMAGMIANIKGARDLYVETITGLPQIVIKFNREAIALFALDIEQVNRVIRTALAGESAGMIYENERRFDLVVRLADEQKKDIDDIRNLLVPTPSGTQVPLYQLADISIKEGPNQIQREDAKRRIVTGFNVRGRDVQSVVKELQQVAGQQLNLPPGYYVKYGGQFENLVEAQERLSVAVPLALLLIFLMLYFAFGSVKQGLLIFSAIPLSAIGGVYALWLRGMPFSISAGIGFIALFGVAVLNGIVLIAEFNRLSKEAVTDIKTLLIRGTHSRLRPVLMTAAVASLGFLPMALSNGAGAEVQRPLATVVIGGLISATLLTLFVLPVLYLWFQKDKKIKMPTIKTLPVWLALIFFANTTVAQQAGTVTSLNQAIEKAKSANLLLNAANTNAGYWKLLQSSVYEWKPLQLDADYGNINSFASDHKFSLSQGFSLPVVYKRQAAYYQSAGEAANLLADETFVGLKKDISLAYYRIALLQEKDKALAAIDSLLAGFLNAAEKRLAAGETNILEKASAEAEWQRVALLRRQLATDLQVEQQSIQLFTNDKTAIQPILGSLLYVLPNAADTVVPDAHPSLRYALQQVDLHKKISALERNKLSPEFSIGYTNQSFIGWQTKDGVNQVYNNGGRRFHSVQAMLAVPLFNKTTRARIKAAKLQEQAAAVQSEYSKQKQSTGMAQWKQKMQKADVAIRYYESTGKGLAETITTTATRSFEKGNIGHMEWMLHMRQVLEIRMAYLDAVASYNEAAIELSFYFTNQK